MLSVDGYFAGPNGELDWHLVDQEFNDYAVDMLKSADLILFGHTTYLMMSSFWPSQYALATDPNTANLMNGLPKMVFSKTLEKADWQNCTIVKGFSAESIQEIKNQQGKDILLLGSGEIVRQFADLKLIDEYRLIINPVLLGQGKLLFAGVNKAKLQLLKIKQFSSGNVLNYYAHASK